VPETQPDAPDWASIDALMARQSGLLARSQALAHGAADHDIARKLRHREWARVHPGVYCNHTGSLSPAQRRWAVVLFHQPAALHGRSALEAFGVRGLTDTQGPVVVAVPASRRPDRRKGIEVRRIADFDQVVQANLSPPRVRLERAVLDLAARAPSESTAVALLADACQTRRTTPGRLAEELRKQMRLPQRRLLLDILDDVASGAYSVLERDYLRRVEVPHGLPVAERQRGVSLGSSACYRDVEYIDTGLIVELDGRLGHEKPSNRWLDLDRDVAAATEQSMTVAAGVAPGAGALSSRRLAGPHPARARLGGGTDRLWCRLPCRHDQWRKFVTGCRTSSTVGLSLSRSCRRCPRRAAP